jgi:phage tail sheath protein FI
MAEYLAPGVYVEEVGFRAKSIAGVSTFLLGIILGVAASLAVDRLRRRCPNVRES